MPATRARKRPIVIDVLHYDGRNFEEARAFLGGDLVMARPTTVRTRTDGALEPIDFTDAIGVVKTREGKVTFTPGYWIMRGVAGEHYVCDPDIFAETYDILDEHGAK